MSGTRRPAARRPAALLLLPLLLAALAPAARAAPAAARPAAARPAAAAPSASPGYANARVIVRFAPAADVVTVAGLAAAPRAGGLAAPLADGAGTHVFTITDGLSVADKVAALNAREDVLIAEPDFEVHAFGAPNDPGYAQQWHLARVGAPAAWDASTGSRDVKVCLIDSGQRIDHPDLAGNVAAGWSVIGRGGGAKPKPGDASWRDYNDTLGHGTHAAGILGALGNNARGGSGAAWRVGLLPCRFIGDSGAGYVSDAITCIQLCKAEGATVYSNSWGGVGYSAALLAEIQGLQAVGGLFVVAAGNDRGQDLDAWPLYPAAYNASNVLTVAATGADDRLAAFSNYGRRSVGIAAPGEGILSTTFDGAYGLMSGTSMATPLVSGAAVILQSIAAAAGATLTPPQLRALLMRTAAPLAANGDRLASGRLDLAAAVAALRVQLGGAAVVPVPEAPAVPAPVPAALPGRAPGGPPLPLDPAVAGPRPRAVTPPCGGSLLRGAAASQSSALGGRGAANAVNGDCRSNAVAYASACAVTDPAKSMPWWTAPLPGAGGAVAAVSLTPRADCCWGSVGGAQVLVGNASWAGSGSRPAFALCGRVPAAPARGQRITVTCARPIAGQRVVVYLPKIRTSLTLCEVDVTLAAPGAAAAILPRATAAAAGAPNARPAAQPSEQRRVRPSSVPAGAAPTPAAAAAERLRPASSAAAPGAPGLQMRPLEAASLRKEPAARRRGRRLAAAGP
jgi:hypothetical protein